MVKARFSLLLSFTAGAISVVGSANAIPPPVPPPEADRMAIAVDLWRIRPITDDERASALGLVASYLSSEALMQAKLERHKRYFDFQWTLAQRIVVNALSRQSAIDAATIECLAKGLAYDLTVEQLTDLKTFVSTPSGSAFWTYNTRIKLVDCMRDPVRRGTERTIAADIKAVRSAR